MRAATAILLALSSAALAADAGSEARYVPLLHYSPAGLTFQAPVSLAGRLEYAGDYPVDRDRTVIGAGVAAAPRARVGFHFESGKAWIPLLVWADYEHDVPTGAWNPRPALGGSGMPERQTIGTRLRKASARAAFGPYVFLAGGFTVSHWGLGLVANDGDHGWEPGSARFTDPRGGDLVLRAAIGTGPLTDLRLVGVLAVDSVRDDDALLTEEELGAPGDEAMQLLGSLIAGQGQDTTGGLYVARRSQTTADGRSLNVTAIDAAGSTKLPLFGAKLSLAAEVALVLGTADVAATADHPLQDVLQFGAAARAHLDLGGFGAALDVLYATGDQNPDDASQNGFRADPNFELGMLLYRHVLAAQTGRAVHTAGDPDLVGVPSPGLERFPTRGAVTNTVAFFPRGFWRPMPGLEIYGGPLFAFAEVALADPLATRLAGGVPHNALGGEPGRYLGTEIDLGVRWRALLGGTQLDLGLEGALLVPGGALGDMDTLRGGRALVEYRL